VPTGGKNRTITHLDYFEIISIYYYVGNRSAYESTRRELLTDIERRFAVSTKPQNMAELTLLFFDLVSCPHVPKETKYKIITAMNYNVLKAKAPSTGELDRVINYCTKAMHFVDWSGALDISYAFRKKELRTPYGE
jgi:hypothetical protein